MLYLMIVNLPSEEELKDAREAEENTVLEQEREVRLSENETESVQGEKTEM